MPYILRNLHRTNQTSWTCIPFIFRNHNVCICNKKYPRVITLFLSVFPVQRFELWEPSDVYIPWVFEGTVMYFCLSRLVDIGFLPLNSVFAVLGTVNCVSVFVLGEFMCCCPILEMGSSSHLKLNSWINGSVPVTSNDWQKPFAVWRSSFFSEVVVDGLTKTFPLGCASRIMMRVIKW